MDTLPNSTATDSKVVIAQLCRSPAFQIRKKLCPKTVARYATAIKAGQQLPPLQVAVVDGVPCLVDGYHRAAALESLGHLEADASITEATREEAQWMAAKANLTHGLQLKPSEMREVFRVYVRTGRHRKSRGRLKSYRDIGLELGRPHTTIRNWMEKDFRKIFNQYGGSSCDADGGCHQLPPPIPATTKAVVSHLDSARQAFQEATCPVAREAFKNRLRDLAEAVLGNDWRDSTDF
ncbi:ParB N-terminal domain-containing protein [Pseudomonas putida]|uniref:ParB N-terminal domain-containing protein n=1 Tax=Pseudomonas TaxID=286 RepID=UPI0034661AED